MHIDEDASEDAMAKGVRTTPTSINLGVDATPEAKSSKTGVSTHNVVTAKSNRHWYALRSTYGREKKAYNYIISSNGIAFYPTKNILLKRGCRMISKEKSLIPNILFAYGTEDEIKKFVYDNVHLPFLRFYYRHCHIKNHIEKTPLIVPDNQINSLRIVCESNNNHTIIASENVKKFQNGQMVQVVNGQFKGVIGRVARYQGQQRVAITINGLLTVITAYIPSAFLQRLDVLNNYQFENVIQ